MVWERVVLHYDEFGRPIETRGYCSHDDGSLPFVIVLGIFNLGALVYAMYEAYLARDISLQYSESEYIMKAIIIMLAVSFIGIPVAIIAREDPIASVYVLSGLIFVVCMSLLSLIFMPKVYFLRDRRRKQLAGVLPAKVHVSNFPNGNSNRKEMTEDRLPAERRKWGSVIINRRASQQEFASLIQLNVELEERVASLEHKRDDEL